ncbi:MAG: efflux RND transporter permease subunit, partial [Leptospiraceae bacterium]|nr:efflux RND transporter permease subunit [Leptospiraceae bacterium]
MQALVQYFLDRGIFVNLLTSLLILMGGYIALTMNREAFPNIDFDIVVITTIYPGASPEEVEKLVTNPIEETIKEVDGIEEYKSVSITNRSQITMKIDPDVDDTAKVVDDIRSAVGRAEDLPEDSEEPIIVEVSTARQPVVEWALERVPDADGNYQVSYAELREFARRMENEFLQMDSVARVERKGWRDAEIFVDVNPDKLRRYNVSTGTIVQALAVRNVNFPGGDIELGKNEITVRTVEEFESENEIARLPLRSNDIGQSVTIGDVARVYEHFEKPEYLEY